MSENKLVNASIIFLAFGLLFVALREFESFLRPFFIALILTFLFAPLSRLSAKKKRIVWGGALILILGIVGIFSVTQGLIEEDQELAQKEFGDNESLQNSVANFMNNPIQIFSFEIVLGNVVDPGKIASIVGSISSSFLSGLGGFFSEFLLTLLFLMFLLPSHHKTIERISREMIPENKRKFKKALLDIEQNIRAYLSIKTFVSFLTAFLSLIVMYFFDVKFMFLFAVLIFALNFIPSIGSIIAVMIVFVTYLITMPFSYVVFILLGLLIFVQFVIGNIVEPKISGKELELSPIVIMLALFFWGSVWGIGGMFFAVPFTSIIKIILKNINSTKKFVKFLN